MLKYKIFIKLFVQNFVLICCAYGDTVLKYIGIYVCVYLW